MQMNVVSVAARSSLAHLQELARQIRSLKKSRAIAPLKTESKFGYWTRSQFQES